MGYSLAAQFPKVLEKVVLCCSGVCLEESDMEEGLFPVKAIDEAANILVPQTPDKLRDLIRFSFVNSKPVRGVPSCFLTDFIDVSPLPFWRNFRILKIYYVNYTINIRYACIDNCIIFYIF